MSIHDEVRHAWLELIKDDPEMAQVMLDLTDVNFRKYLLLRLEVLERKVRILQQRGF